VEPPSGTVRLEFLNVADCPVKVAAANSAGNVDFGIAPSGKYNFKGLPLNETYVLDITGECLSGTKYQESVTTGEHDRKVSISHQQ
jgi:hypothetical protein